MQKEAPLQRLLPFAAGLALFFACFAAYFHVGKSLYESPAQPFHVTDILFDSDADRAVEDMTNPAAVHYRSRVHPLFVLFTNPLGSTLAKALGGEKELAALWMTSWLGALSSLVCFLLFWNASRDASRAFLLALAYSFSMSKLVFSSIPETYALGMVSLSLTYLLLWTDLYRARLPWGVWLLAALFTLGVTTTNFVQTFLCFAVARFDAKNLRRWAVSAASWALAVLASGAALAVIQQKFYPTTFLFFRRSAVTHELANYASLRLFERPWEVLSELLRNFFVVNVAGPSFRVMPSNQGVMEKVSFSGAFDFSALGWTALALWAALALAGASPAAFKKHGRFYLALALCVASNLCLHAFYGFEPTGEIEYFIFTGNFTLAVMLLGLIRRSWAGNIWVLAAFAAALTANNLSVMNGVIAFYRLP